MFFFDNYQAIVIDVLIAVIIALLCVICRTLISMLKAYREQKVSLDNDRKNLVALALATARSQMIEHHEQWTERGYVTRAGLEGFIIKYKAYEELGGNGGLVKQLYNEVMNLPIRRIGGSEY